MLGPLKNSLAPLMIPAAVVSAAASTYKAAVLADSPIAYWRLDETSGTSMLDSSGNGNHGTYSATGVTLGQTGALTGSGDSDAAAAFDGSSGYASTSVTVTGSGSVECWLKLPNTGSFFSWFIGDTVDFSGLRVSSGTSPEWCDDNVDSYAAPAIGTNIWAHLVATFNPTTINLYVNGALASTGASHTPSFGAVVIGGRQSGSNLCDCIVDEVAIYSSVLSSTRVLAHYNAGI